MNDDCCVCLGPVTAPRLRRLHCNHLLHKQCAVRWFARNRSCPLCRHPEPPPASRILRAVLRRGSRFDKDLPSRVKAALADHPDAYQATDLAYRTVDSSELLRVMRALGL